MEFEGEDQRTLNKLVRTLSGRLDFLIDGDQRGGAAGGSASPAEDARTLALNEDVSEEGGGGHDEGGGGLFEDGKLGSGYWLERRHFEGFACCAMRTFAAAALLHLIETQIIILVDHVQ